MLKKYISYTKNISIYLVILLQGLGDLKNPSFIFIFFLVFFLFSDSRFLLNQSSDLRRFHHLVLTVLHIILDILGPNWASRIFKMEKERKRTKKKMLKIGNVVIFYIGMCGGGLYSGRVIAMICNLFYDTFTYWLFSVLTFPDL